MFLEAVYPKTIIYYVVFSCAKLVNIIVQKKYQPVF